MMIFTHYITLIEHTVQLINFSLRYYMLPGPLVPFSISTMGSPIHVIIVISKALVRLSLDFVWLACTLVGLSSVLFACFFILLLALVTL